MQLDFTGIAARRSVDDAESNQQSERLMSFTESLLVHINIEIIQVYLQIVF